MTSHSVQKKPQESKDGGVGSLLKKTREKYDLDLKDVSAYLNIRRGLLEAIEEERYQDLPGTVYVIGFIKSYSDYLGLDPDAMVNKFKQETGKQIHAVDLDIPVPATESRLPDQKIILMSVVVTIALIALMTWFFGKSDVVQKNVVAVPEVTEIFPDQDEVAPFDNTLVKTIDLEKEENSTVVQSTSKETEKTTQIQTSIEPQDIIEEQVITQQQDSLSTSPTTPPIVSNGANTLLEAGTGSTIYGAENVDARIAIKAKQNSWIEIKDEKNNILLSRVLRMGDIYYVPSDRQSYLTTGNAGGLEIYIDKNFAGVAGKPGEVLRLYQITVNGLIAPKN